MTADEAVALALRDNPHVRAASREVAAAEAGVGAARARANPTVTVAPGILGPAGSDEELSVTQPLEINGSRGARTRLARSELRAARGQAAVTVRDLVREVKRAYYELARVQEVRSLAAGSVTIAEEFARIARRQAELGARPGIDVTQLQVELVRARQLLLQSEAGVRLAAAELNTLMGRGPDTPIAEVSRLAFAPSRTETAPAAEAVLARRGEVTAQEAQLDLLRSRADLIRAEGRPELVLGGRLESFTERLRTGGVHLGVTLPILDYGGRRSRLRQAERLVEAQAARVEAARNAVSRDVAVAVARLQTAEQLVRQYEEGLLSQARRLAEAERTRFQTGQGSPLTVLEAQRTYRAVLSDYYAALAAHEQAKADLEWAVGGVAPPAEIVRPTRSGSGQTDRDEPS